MNPMNEWTDGPNRRERDPDEEAVRPILAAELGDDAELVELSALMTCKNSPAGSFIYTTRFRRST